MNRLWELLPSFTLWEIWKTRNKQSFEKKARKQEEIWNSIEAHLKETISLQLWMQEEYSTEANERIILYDLGIRELPPNNSIARTPPVHVSSPNCCHDPLAGTFKLNMDGVAKGNPRKTRYGGAIINMKGDIIS